MTVPAMKRGIHIEQGLHVIVLGRQRRYAGQRITNRAIVDHRGLLGLEPVDIDSEQRWRIGEEYVHLKSWLGSSMGRHHEQDPAVERLSRHGLRERHLEFEGSMRGRRLRQRRRGQRGQAFSDRQTLDAPEPRVHRTALTGADGLTTLILRY